MNIFAKLSIGLFNKNQKIFNQTYKMMNFQNFQPMIAERKQNVVTHRNEFLPFTFNNLWDNPGAKKQKRRVGRGIGSSKGRTSGRGEKGQHSRSGGSVHPRFEGGQSSIVRRLPKLGMSIRNRERPIYVNLSKIIYHINQGRLDPSKLITMKDLHTAGVFNTAKFGVKILGRGSQDLNIKLDLEVTDASQSAIDAIKEQGGSVKCVYKTKLLMKEVIHPEKFPFKLRNPIPTSRKVKQMERIRERGAEVEYVIPEWMQEELKQKEKEDKEDKEAEQEGFQIPVPRVPGSGKEKIRKRKPVIWRTINYGI